MTTSPKAWYNKDKERGMKMYYFEIEWITRAHGEEETIVEQGNFPIHIPAEEREEALTQVLKIAQNMAMAFRDTEITFYYRII